MAVVVAAAFVVLDAVVGDYDTRRAPLLLLVVVVVVVVSTKVLSCWTDHRLPDAAVDFEEEGCGLQMP